MKKKECCNNICVNCKNYRKGWMGINDECSIPIRQVEDCVAGTVVTVLLDPYEANAKGDCKYYEEDRQKILWNEIYILLKRYEMEVFYAYHGDYEGWNEYHPVMELIKTLEQPRKWISDDCSESATKPKKKHWWN